MIDAEFEGLSSTLESLAALHAAELPQKDELCGAFCGALALRAAGISASDGVSIDQDLVAIAAGSRLSTGAHDSLPPGEPGRRDYRLDIPTVRDPELSGTSAAGLARAILGLSARELDVVPIAGPWTESSVLRLLQLAAPEERATFIANVATRHFWAPQLSAAAAFGYLAGESLDGPASDWDVGHFVLLLGCVRGRARSLVLVADTYSSRGWQGLHLQPPARLAAALARPELPTSGGVLIVVDADKADTVAQAARSEGFEIRLWDNGTSDLDFPADAV